VTGSLFVTYVAIYHYHLLPVWEFVRLTGWNGLWMGLSAITKASDFWIWFYLTFTISSTMMPSESDRHAWLPLGLLAGILLGIAFLAGAGPWMLENLAGPFNSFLRALALIFGLSGIFQILLILPFLLLHLVLSKMTGVDIG
jgi:hypothetical protein